MENNPEIIECFIPDKKNLIIWFIVEFLGLIFFVWDLSYRGCPSGNSSLIGAEVFLILVLGSICLLALFLFFPSDKGKILVTRKGLINYSLFKGKEFIPWHQIENYQLRDYGTVSRLDLLLKSENTDKRILKKLTGFYYKKFTHSQMIEKFKDYKRVFG